MAIEDKEKWNKKYKNTPKLLEDREASIKLKNIINKTKGKKALDIACGGGKNSIYLAKNGFSIDAMDISDVALESIEKRAFKNINTIQIDLEEKLNLKNEYYDLIVQTNFLDRSIIPALKNSLKKEGLIFIETYMHHEINEKQASNKSFLLKKDELKELFKEGFEILDYDEFDNEDFELYKMKKQSIIAKKN